MSKTVSHGTTHKVTLDLTLPDDCQDLDWICSGEQVFYNLFYTPALAHFASMLAANSRSEIDDESKKNYEEYIKQKMKMIEGAMGSINYE